MFSKYYVRCFNVNKNNILLLAETLHSDGTALSHSNEILYVDTNCFRHPALFLKYLLCIFTHRISVLQMRQDL